MPGTDELDLMTFDATLEVLNQQLNTLLIYLERPAVQAQILALVILTLVAYLLARIASGLTRRITRRAMRGRADTTRDRFLNRWMPAINQLYFPIFARIGIEIAIYVLRDAGIAFGLVSQAVLFYWLLLGYIIVVTILYAIFSEQVVHPYHRYLLNPLVALLVIWWLGVTLLDINLLLGIQIITILETAVTLGNIVSAFITLYFFIILSRLLQDILRGAVMPRFSTDPGLINTVLTLTRYVVLGLGGLATFGALGFNLTTLTVILGGLSVGIGLGLQNLVSNFFSGIVLLFEQSIRPGDMVDIDGNLGIVKNLSIRSTTVRTFDNISVVIPNETVITSNVIVHVTTDDVKKRMWIRVNVSYDANPTQVRDVLVQTALQHGLVLRDPAPTAHMVGFGDFGLQFWLFAWVARLDQRFDTQNELHMMIHNAFKKHGIEIPYPQRDLNLRRGWEALQPNQPNGERSRSAEEDAPLSDSPV